MSSKKFIFQVSLGLTLFGNITSAQAEVFFTEYTEHFNNDALELFNPSTTDTIDLSDYTLKIFPNGQTSAVNPLKLRDLTLPPSSTLILANSYADNEILDRVKSTNGKTYFGVFFDGNDTIILEKSDGTIVDSIGRLGENKYWGSGYTHTTEHTLRRKSHLKKGDPIVNDEFIPSDEWIGYPKNTFDGLGIHKLTNKETPNVPPTANAGSDQNTLTETEVTLDGSNSQDSDGIIASYQWKQTNGTTVTLSKNGTDKASNPTFTTPKTFNPETISFELTVTDNSGATATDTVDIKVAVPSACHHAPTLISAIQGSTETSPLVGQTLTAKGVVTKLLTHTNSHQGFIIQEEDSDQDGDSNTSEALFIQDIGHLTSDIKQGDVVAVHGEVIEANGITQLKALTGIEKCADSATVTPHKLTLPFAANQDFESLENMLVTFEQTLTVTDTDNLTRFGQMTLASGGKLNKPTQAKLPGNDAIALKNDNAVNQIIMDDGLNDATASSQNPSTIRFDGFGDFSYENTIRAGYQLNNLTGIWYYGTNQLDAKTADTQYRLIPNQAINFDKQNSRENHNTVPDIKGNVRIASLHLENLFFKLTDGNNNNCGPQSNLPCLGAESAESMPRQITKIVSTLKAIDVDIVGLMTMENHPTDNTLKLLINTLNQAMGSEVYTYLNTGTIGVRATKVALIYKSGTVTPVGDFSVLAYEDDLNHPSLIQAFKPTAKPSDDNTVTVIVNHFQERTGDCSSLGDNNKNDGQEQCSATRLKAAQALTKHITDKAYPQVVVLGHLGAFRKEDTIRELTDKGLINLADNYVDNSYTASQKGEWGTLDYIFINQALDAKVKGMTEWHINADEPKSLSYHNEKYYNSTVLRSSSYDPVFMGLELVAEVPDNGPSGGDGTPTEPTPPNNGSNNNNTSNNSSGGGGGGSLPIIFLALLSYAFWRRYKV